jgi:hypothetical protein
LKRNQGHEVKYKVEGKKEKTKKKGDDLRERERESESESEREKKTPKDTKPEPIPLSPSLPLSRPLCLTVVEACRRQNRGYVVDGPFQTHDILCWTRCI